MTTAKQDDFQSVLITGASGFLGRNLSSRLSHSERYKLILVNRENHFDLSSNGWTDKIPATQVDIVIHLVQSNRFREFPEGAEDMFQVNMASTFELLEWARNHGVKRFIFASTGNVYKEQKGKVKEFSDCDPGSFYATSKYCAEKLIESYVKYFEVINTRIFGLYGPGQKDNLIDKIIKNVQSGNEITLASGEGLFLTPIFIEDAIDSFICLMNSPLPSPKLVVNLAGDEILSLHDIVFSISKVIDKSPIIKETGEEPKYLCGDNLNYNSIFGARNFIDFEEGIRKTLNQ
jgi:UDP-glucose 4-epimerase